MKPTFTSLHSQQVRTTDNNSLLISETHAAHNTFIVINRQSKQMSFLVLSKTNKANVSE